MYIYLLLFHLIIYIYKINYIYIYIKLILFKYPKKKKSQVIMFTKIVTYLSVFHENNVMVLYFSLRHQTRRVRLRRSVITYCLTRAKTKAQSWSELPLMKKKVRCLVFRTLMLKIGKHYSDGDICGLLNIFLSTYYKQIDNIVN